MLHPREIQILNDIAKLDTPAISQDIAIRTRISQSTVQAVLRKMLAEGYVENVGVTHSGNVLARQYAITDKVKEELLQQMVDLYSSFKNIVSIDDVCDALQNIKND